MLVTLNARREKLQRSFVKLREQILEKQLGLLADEGSAQHLSLLEMSAMLEANHGASVYDRLFSHPEAEVHSETDFEMILARISGEITENSAQVPYSYNILVLCFLMLRCFERCSCYC